MSVDFGRSNSAHRQGLLELWNTPFMSFLRPEFQSLQKTTHICTQCGNFEKNTPLRTWGIELAFLCRDIVGEEFQLAHKEGEDLILREHMKHFVGVFRRRESAHKGDLVKALEDLSTSHIAHWTSYLGTEHQPFLL
jgi:hypothetical protein